MESPRQLAISADAAILSATPAWRGWDTNMIVATSSIERRRFAKTARRRGLSYRVRVYILRCPMGPSGRTAWARFLRDDAIRRVIV